MSEPGYLIGESLLGKIRGTVAKVEGNPVVGKVSRIPTRFEDQEDQPRKVLRVGTFSGNWNIDTTAVVTFINAPTATVVAHNLFVDNPPLDKVAVAKEGTAWYAVEFLRDEPEPFIRICEFTGAWNIKTSKVVTLKYEGDGLSTLDVLNLFANVPAPPSTADCAVAREGTAWFLIAAECITAT
jgi:hypothetical protein